MKLKLLWVCLAAFLLMFSGCIDTGSSSKSSKTNLPDFSDDSNLDDISMDDIEVTINEFEVIGSSEPVDGVVPINAGVNDGKFSVSWDVFSNIDLYHVELFVSKDGSTDGDAVKFFARNCGYIGSSCSQKGEFECNFTQDNQIFCGNTDGHNLTDFLDQLPQELFIVLKTVDSLFQESAKQAQVKVQLQ